MLLFAHLLLLPLAAFLLPVLFSFVHIFHSQLHLQTLHLDGHAHDLLHLLLRQFLLLYLKLVQSIVIRGEMHEFVFDGKGWILGKVEGVQHLLLSLFVALDIVDLSNTVFKDIVATTLRFTSVLLIILDCLLLFNLLHFI
jgi:hypothetical protein